ncbi:MAG: general stress protein [Actinomycetes bacterium]
MQQQPLPDAGVYPGDRPASTSRTTLATFSRYEDAQRLVDQLSDAGFDVQTLTIVGCDLRSVEHVTGRLTTGRAALYGAGFGAWWGLFVGLLLALFSAPFWAPLITALVVGALFGAAFGAGGHAATRGRRDFTSVRTLEADRYEVLVAADAADRARSALAAR